MSIFHLKYVQMCQGESGGTAWIPIRIRHRSIYGSYMDPYVDRIWVVYMQMCSQLIQHVNISFEICENMSGGLWEAVGALRGRFGQGSGKVRGRFGEGSGQIREHSWEATGGASARPPCGHLDGTLMVLLLEPSSELAIRKLS